MKEVEASYFYSRKRSPEKAVKDANRMKVIIKMARREQETKQAKQRKLNTIKRNKKKRSKTLEMQERQIDSA